MDLRLRAMSLSSCLETLAGVTCCGSLNIEIKNKVTGPYFFRSRLEEVKRSIHISRSDMSSHIEAMASIEMGGRNPNWFRRQLVGVKNKEGNQYSAGLMPPKLIFEEQDSAQYQVHTKIIEIL